MSQLQRCSLSDAVAPFNRSGMPHGFEPEGLNHVAPLNESLAPSSHFVKQPSHHQLLFHSPSNKPSGSSPLVPQQPLIFVTGQQQLRSQLQDHLSYSTISPPAPAVSAVLAESATAGAIVGSQYRSPSRLFLSHSQLAPVLQSASGAMSLSTSSLGGGLPPNHPGYKSHSLLPNGHHPSQMGAVGTVTTMSSIGGLSGGGLQGVGPSGLGMGGIGSGGVVHQHPSLPPHSVSRLSHSFMTTFPATHHQNHTRQSSLLLNTDQNTTTQKDLSTTAPTSATGLTGAHSGSPGASGHTGVGGASPGAIAINSSLLTSTYHHALSLLCMLSVLMCVLSASVLRPLESTDVTTERALRDVLSVCLLVLSMCLDLHCLFVCSLQLMLALREGSSAYLKRASCSRNLAVCSFLLSVPFFLTGVILLLDIPLPASLAIIGVVFLVCIASSLHNVYVWHLVVQSGEASNNAKALNGHIVQLSTLV
ncbi:uncharacterized protein LOC111245797 isoform X3 [Varroa destructor]|uniref:Uncharacterized protein n=1 Tax=Varroa destructor TaxID=109461 RepID=A0A7M7JD58_VARDE|nr:uncharacterized protein LOC111245797 isoform X3 [Varroa destructor]